LELEKLKLQNIRLTREYSMEDDLIDIRFEYESHQSNLDVVEHVNFMREVLAIIFVVIELANQKIGPIMHLKGWSTHMTKNMKRFDRVLEKFYHRFWRRGQMSPMTEFGWLVIGSMIMWHIQNKYLGGLPISDMMGGLGMGGSKSSTTAPEPPPQQGGGGLGGLGGLGSIFKMFTGGMKGGNNNRPSAPRSTRQSAPPRPRSPVIIPPAVPRMSRQSEEPRSSSRRRTMRRPSSHLREDPSPRQPSHQSHPSPQPQPKVTQPPLPPRASVHPTPTRLSPIPERSSRTPPQSRGPLSPPSDRDANDHPDTLSELDQLSDHSN
jgi:hypothetical protein